MNSAEREREGFIHGTILTTTKTIQQKSTFIKEAREEQERDSLTLQSQPWIVCFPIFIFLITLLELFKFVCGIDEDAEIWACDSTLKAVQWQNKLTIHHHHHHQLQLDPEMTKSIPSPSKMEKQNLPSHHYWAPKKWKTNKQLYHLIILVIVLWIKLN